MEIRLRNVLASYGNRRFRNLLNLQNCLYKFSYTSPVTIIISGKFLYYSTDGKQRDSKEFSNENPENNSNNDQPNEKMPMGSRVMMLLWLGTIFYILYKLQSSEEANLFKFVSWNEFVREMLSKGEVIFSLVIAWR